MELCASLVSGSPDPSSYPALAGPQGAIIDLASRRRLSATGVKGGAGSGTAGQNGIANRLCQNARSLL
jgi:hypothetical protein